MLKEKITEQVRDREHMKATVITQDPDCLFIQFFMHAIRFHITQVAFMWLSSFFCVRKNETAENKEVSCVRYFSKLYKLLTAGTEHLTFVQAIH